MKKIRIVQGRGYRTSELGIYEFLERAGYEDCADAIWGVYVGGCVGGDSAWRLFHEIHGHAHNDEVDEWFGWVCILEPKHVLTPTQRLTGTLIHEIAHILAPNEGHSRRWKRIVTELGAPQEAKSKKKPLPSIERAHREVREELRIAARRLR